MNGRNEIVSAGGVPGNRHATSVPSAFPRRSDPVAAPLSDRPGRPPRRRHEMRSLAHEFATQRNATPPHESWDAPGPGTDRDTRRSRGSRRPRSAPRPGRRRTHRRAVLRRALRMGLLRPASRLRDVQDT